MDIFNVIENCLVAIKKHPIFLVPAFVIFIVGIVLGLGMSAAVFTQVALSVAPGQGVLPAAISSLPLILAVLIIAAVISFIAGIYIKGAYIDMAHSWKAKNISLSKSFGVAWSRYRDLFVYELIVVIIDLVIAAILLGPLVYISMGSILLPYLNNIPIPRAVAIGFLTTSLIVGVIYLIAMLITTILFSMGSPIVVLDKKGPMEALHQSIAIGKKETRGLVSLFVMEAVIVIALTVVAGAVGIIPLIGFILSTIMYLIITAFGELVVPMYYVTFHKKPAVHTAHRQPAAAAAPA